MMFIDRDLTPLVKAAHQLMNKLLGLRINAMAAALIVGMTLGGIRFDSAGAHKFGGLPWGEYRRAASLASLTAPESCRAGF
jgi:hypothetical protein